MTNVITFDFVAQSKLNAAFLNAQKVHKETVKNSRDNLGRVEIETIMPAILYGVDSGFDLQPLADVIKANKFSAITKRAVKALFPAHSLMINPETKRASLVRNDVQAAMVAQDKLDILKGILASGDGIHCEQMKTAFPEPELDKGVKIAKVGSALIKRLEKDGITKAELLEYLKNVQ